jgi:hypothetical protein
MFGRDPRGVESLPMILIISLALGMFAITLGMKSMVRVKSLLGDQQSIEGFDTLVEHVYSISFGGVGGKRSFELELPESEIIVRGKIIQLEIENEVCRSVVLPLPILLDGFEDEFSIQSGGYTLELQRVSDDSSALGKGDYFLRLRRGDDESARLPGRLPSL